MELVHSSDTVFGSAQTDQFPVLVLEFVVVSDFFSGVDVSVCEEDDFVFVVDVDDARVAVGIAAVIDEPAFVSLHRRVHDVFRVHS